LPQGLSDQESRSGDRAALLISHNFRCTLPAALLWLGMPRNEPWSADRASEIIAQHRHLPGATLPILHALQETFGCVPAAAVPLVADALNLSRAEIHGTVTFYHDFRREPPGRRVLKLCLAESCQAAGGDALVKRAKEKLGVEMGATTPDRRVTLEPVYCLGLCHSSPTAMLDKEVYGMLDAAKLDALVRKAQA
jgi:formate dehydrogenase subunit gamma